MGDAYIEFASDAKGVSVEVRFRKCACLLIPHALHSVSVSLVALDATAPRRLVSPVVALFSMCLRANFASAH